MLYWQPVDGTALNSTTTHILCKENTFKEVNIHHLFHLHHFLFHSILIIPSLSATWLLESLSLITSVFWMTISHIGWKDLDFCSSTWTVDKMIPALWPCREISVWGRYVLETMGKNSLVRSCLCWLRYMSTASVAWSTKKSVLNCS